jgi:hypothetical protein
MDKKGGLVTTTIVFLDVCVSLSLSILISNTYIISNVSASSPRLDVIGEKYPKAA